MKLFQGFRAHTAARFTAATGCEPAVAELAAVATHPFANRHRPASREMEKTIRGLSSDFTRQSRGTTDPEQLRVESRKAVRLYLQHAEQARDDYYVRSYREALESIARSGESAGIIFSPDSIEERRLNVRATYPDIAELDADRLLLPQELRERAVAAMLEQNGDAGLTAELARSWVDWATLNDRWHGGWIDDQPNKAAVEPVPGQQGVFISRDLDASAAVWRALSEAGLDPATYLKDTPPRAADSSVGEASSSTA